MPKFGVSIYSISRKIMTGEWTAMQGIRWLAEQGAEAIELVPFGIAFIYEGMEDCQYGTKVSLDNLKRIWVES